MCLQYSRDQTDCLMAYWTQHAIKIIQNDLKFTKLILKIEKKEGIQFSLTLLFTEKASQNERQPLDSSLAGKIYNIFHDKSFCVRFSPGEADGAETHHHSDHSWITEGSCLIDAPWKPLHAMELAQAWQLKSSFLDKHTQRTCAALATSAH